MLSLFVYSENGEHGFVWNFKPVSLCVLYCFISSFVGNVILKEYHSAYEFVIVTAHPEEIEKEILNNLRHSATKIVGSGLYSNSEKTILLCVINKHQLVEFKNIIKTHSDTFAFVTTVNDTLGNFKKIK